MNRRFLGLLWALLIVIAWPLSVGPARGGSFDLMTTAEATISDIHAALEARQLTCRQLVQLYIDRIEAYDKKGPALNAIIMVNPNALAVADALDAKYAQSSFAGPLHCVPVIVKDNFNTVDMPTSAGSLSLKGSMPPSDAFQVRKLREAGALILAKSNMAELAWSPFETVGSLLPAIRATPMLSTGCRQAPAAGRQRRSQPASGPSASGPTPAIRSAARLPTQAWSASARQWG